MNIFGFSLLIAGLGAVGGFASCFRSGERNFLPHFEEDLKVWTPGWMGNIVFGAVAAFVVWAVYGPLASFDLINGDTTKAALTLAQAGSSIIVGLSGGKILTLLAQKEADRVAKDTLVGISKKLSPKNKKQV